MTTVTVKTTELEGAALDWAVAKAIKSGAVYINGGAPVVDVFSEEHGDFFPEDYEPSTDWSEGGPLIAEYKAEFRNFNNEYECRIEAWDDEGIGYDAIKALGDTHLIAAMRAIVAAELGDTVEIPEELLQ